MGNSIKSNEFVGRFGISYKDGEMIYAYDEITHGLYRFTLSERKVTLVLSSASIHRNTDDRIMGISKSGNEIILIPLFTDSEWIFYDTKTEGVRYASPVQDRVRISSAHTIGSNLFLIPSAIYNPIIILTLNGMKIIKTYENWYKNKSDMGTFIWGASSYDDFVVFPVIDSNTVCYLSIEEMRIITLDIPHAVLSVSAFKDKIWILPISGRCIYAINLNGEIVDKVRLFHSEQKTSAGNFIRIVAAEENVFLLPVYGENIYIYQYRKKCFVQLEAEETPLWGGLFAESRLSYWESIIEDRTIHLLPGDYQYRRIDIDTLESESNSFQYGYNINNDDYMKMLEEIYKIYSFRERKSDLEDFFRFIFCLPKKHFMDKGIEIGKKIWKRL